MIRSFRGRVVALAAIMVAAACGFSGVGTGPDPTAEGGRDGAASADGAAGADGIAGDTNTSGETGSDGGDADAPTTADADSGGLPCPTVCSSCNAGTCFITGSGKTCPPRFACDITCTSATCQNKTFDCTLATACAVHCTGSGVCDDSTVACGAGACKVVCGGPGCDRLSVQAASASSFCFQCNGNPGCDHFKCTPPAGGCTKACKANCGDIGMCNTCATVATCP